MSAEHDDEEKRKQRQSATAQAPADPAPFTPDQAANYQAYSQPPPQQHETQRQASIEELRRHAPDPRDEPPPQEPAGPKLSIHDMNQQRFADIRKYAAPDPSPVREAAFERSKQEHAARDEAQDRLTKDARVGLAVKREEEARRQEDARQAQEIEDQKDLGAITKAREAWEARHAALKAGQDNSVRDQLDQILRDEARRQMEQRQAHPERALSGIAHEFANAEQEATTRSAREPDNAQGIEANDVTDRPDPAATEHEAETTREPGVHTPGESHAAEAHERPAEPEAAQEPAADHAAEQTDRRQSENAETREMTDYAQRMQDAMQSSLRFVQLKEQDRGQER